MKNQEQKIGGNNTSNFTHHTSQKGITLIALIITIIVMLILVGVTINVAMNGGLMEKAGIAKEEQQKAIEKEQLQEFILGKMDENLKISEGILGQIKIGEKTYDVTAAEGTGENAGDIVLTLTSETETLQPYTIEGDLKIKGVTIKPAEETHSFTLNEIDAAIQEAYGKEECESANLAETYMLLDNAINVFMIPNNIVYEILGTDVLVGEITYENGTMIIANEPGQLVAGDNLFLAPTAMEGMIGIGLIRYTGSGYDENDGYVIVTPEALITQYGNTVFTLES